MRGGGEGSCEAGAGVVREGPWGVGGMSQSSYGGEAGVHVLHDRARSAHP